MDWVYSNKKKQLTQPDFLAEFVKKKSSKPKTADIGIFHCEFQFSANLWLTLYFLWNSAKILKFKILNVAKCEIKLQYSKRLPINTTKV